MCCRYSLEPSRAFFLRIKRIIIYGSVEVHEALIYVSDNIFLRLGTNLYRQIVGIPIGTTRSPLVAGLRVFRILSMRF